MTRRAASSASPARRNAPCTVAVKAAVLSDSAGTAAFYPRVLIYRQDYNAGGPEVYCEYGDGSTGSAPSPSLSSRSLEHADLHSGAVNIGGTADCVRHGRATAGDVDQITVPVRLLRRALHLYVPALGGVGEARPAGYPARVPGRATAHAARPSTIVRGAQLRSDETRLRHPLARPQRPLASPGVCARDDARARGGARRARKAARRQARTSGSSTRRATRTSATTSRSSWRADSRSRRSSARAATPTWPRARAARWRPGARSSTRRRSSSAAGEAMPTSSSASRSRPPSASSATRRWTPSSRATRRGPRTSCSCASTARASRAVQGVAPEHMHIELGSGRRESLRPRDFDAYFARAQRSLERFVDAPPATVALSLRGLRHVRVLDRLRRGVARQGRPLLRRGHPARADRRARGLGSHDARGARRATPCIGTARRPGARDARDAARAGRLQAATRSNGMSPPDAASRSRRAGGSSDCPSPRASIWRSTSRATRSGVPTAS